MYDYLSNKMLPQKKWNCYLYFVDGAHSLTKTNKNHTENTDSSKIKYK